MLKLCAEHTDDVYTLLGSRQYTVGRKDCDISVPDKSISRNHAHLEVCHPRANITNPALQPTLRVTDVGSKCGTYLEEQIDITDGTRIQMRQPIILQRGSRIRFGCELGGQFRVKYTPLVVTWSQMTTTSELVDSIGQLGGHMVSRWISECRFVVMNSLVLTIKVGCALLAGGFVVSPYFFQDWVHAIQTNSTPPEPLNYTPPLAERSLSSSDFTLQPLPTRVGLFRNKTFLFTENDLLNKFQVLIQTGGGIAKMVLDCPSSQLASPDIIMIIPLGQLSSLDEATVKAMYMYQTCGKRLIAISNLCLAILYARMDKECNPYYKLSSKESPENESEHEMMESENNNIIPATQTPSPNRPHGRSEITTVPETQSPSPFTTTTITTRRSIIKTTSRRNECITNGPSTTTTVYGGRAGQTKVSNNEGIRVGDQTRRRSDGRSSCSKRRCDAHIYSEDDGADESFDEVSEFTDNFAASSTTFNINQSVHTRVRVQTANPRGTTNNRDYRFIK